MQTLTNTIRKEAKALKHQSVWIQFGRMALFTVLFSLTIGSSGHQESQLLPQTQKVSHPVSLTVQVGHFVIK